jgi:tripartite-type tricarboxylate transporter receptor subunit TctC
MLRALALLAGLALASQWAFAQDAGAFLRGQTVRFIVGYSPGGGYDAYARMLAPHFEKRTGATVVIENRPGGGGRTALNQLARAKPDGLTLQVLNGESAVMSQLTKEAGVAYDMATVSMLARIAEEPHFFLVNPRLPDSLQEIIASGRKLKFAATSRIDNLGDYAAITCHALGMNCQIVTGYKGSKEASLALMNGEVDALTISESSGFTYSQGGRSKIVVTLGHKRSALRPDVPTVYEMFQLAPEQKWWLDFRLGIKSIGRALIGPPGIPAARLAHLRGLWRDILTDAAVVEEGAKSQRGIDYGTGQELEKTARALLQSLPAERLEQIHEVLLKKF